MPSYSYGLQLSLSLTTRHDIRKNEANLHPQERSFVTFRGTRWAAAGSAPDQRLAAHLLAGFRGVLRKHMGGAVGA